LDHARITQKTVVEFLGGTGVPLAAGVSGLLRWANGGLLLVSAASVVWLLVAGADAFDPDRLWSGYAAPLAALPMFAFGVRAARKRRFQIAAYGLVAGIHALTVVASVIRGPYAGAWYVLPVLAVASTFALGVVPGLTFTLLGSAALGWTGWSVVEEPLPIAVGLDPRWHCTTLMMVTLAAGLLGAFLNKILLSALWSERFQRDRFRDSRKALRHRERLLRHALRVETVGDLAGLVVHQLRNQLQLVLGHVFVGQKSGGDVQRERMELIAEALHEARPLLDQLMGLAHPDDGKPEAGDLSVLVGEFTAKVERILPRRLTLEVSLSPKPLPVLLDRLGLEHALWNLIINAGQAMPEFGKVTIETGGGDGSAWVAVEDTGTGIDAENIGLIFEPYFTTKQPGEGTGLGLTAVSRFVRGSHGEVDVDSEVGRGTRFTLRFPGAESQGSRVG